MKPRKIRRHYSYKRRNPYRHRTPIWKILGTVLGCVAVVALGVLAGKLLLDGGKQPDTDLPSGTTTSSTASTTTGGETPPTQAVIPTATLLSDVKAFYLPHTALSNTDTLQKTLADAKAAGFTGVVLELKDSVGRVYFQATSDTAKQAGGIQTDAVSKEQLQAVLAACDEQEMLAIGYLYAFCDRTCQLDDARVMHIDGGGWLDNYANKGGKAWLNPYKPAARNYLIGLGEELQDIGFTALIYDGVQFPSQRTAAYFDSSLSNQLKPEIAALQTFVTEAKATLNACQVSICCTGAAATGTGTDIYGSDNPLKLGSDYLSPLLPSTGTKELLDKIVFRADEFGENTPTLLPWLQIDGLNAKQIRTNIDVVGDLPFVLYNTTGSYDFTALSR